jgi:hypothetical protein
LALAFAFVTFAFAIAPAAWPLASVVFASAFAFAFVDGTVRDSQTARTHAPGEQLSLSLREHVRSLTSCISLRYVVPCSLLRTS